MEESTSKSLKTQRKLFKEFLVCPIVKRERKEENPKCFELKMSCNPFYTLDNRGTFGCRSQLCPIGHLDQKGTSTAKNLSFGYPSSFCPKHLFKTFKEQNS